MELAAALVTLPAYVLVTAAAFAAGIVLLVRRGAIREPALWVTVLVVGIVAEVVTKHFLTRPALYGRSGHGLVHFVAFDASYPSGHTVRICLVGALVVRLWPRLWPVVAVWIAAAAALLVAGGAHTLTDVAGGALVAGLLIAGLAIASVGRGTGGRSGEACRRRPPGR